MLANLLKTLQKILLPESLSNEGLRSMAPIQVLTSIHQRLAQLAAQIEAHADSAPYPHVAQRLRQIAYEKETRAAEIKEWIESRGGWVGHVSTAPAPGKNHWQRMMRDLSDQRALEHFVLLQEPRLSRESPELAEFIRRLKFDQAVHRDALTQLAAVADPQATQT